MMPGTYGKDWVHGWLLGGKWAWRVVRAGLGETLNATLGSWILFCM